MWIKASGELSENVYQIITPTSAHFLVYGERAALVDTGISASQDELVAELRAQLGDGSLLKYILITHTHFDHIGGLPYVKQFAPEAEVIASPACSEIFARSEFLHEAYEKNLECAEALGREMGFGEEEWRACFKLDRILGDGDAVDLGDEVDVKLIAAPGHTDDTVAYYVRSDSALVAGEAVGSYGGRDKRTSCFMSSYGDYTKTLEKLALLDVKILGLPHAGAVTGELAQKYLVDARLEAERFYTSVSERLEQGELVDEIYQELLAEWQHENISPDGPFISTQTECLNKMISIIAAERG